VGIKEENGKKGGRRGGRDGEKNGKELKTRAVFKSRRHIVKIHVYEK